MRLFAAVALAAVTCSACVTGLSEDELQPFLTRMQPVLPPNPDGFIRDEREPASKKAGYLGGFSYDCNFGIDRLGEVGAGSDRIARLERDLRGAFPQRPDGPVVLRKYTIYHNRAYDALLPQINGGLVGGFISQFTMPPGKGQRVRCKQEEMTGGWFDKADITNEFSPITIDIDIRFGEHNYVVTAAYSPPLELVSEVRFMGSSMYNVPNNLDRPEWVVSVQEAMAKANARLIETIQKGQST